MIIAVAGPYSANSEEKRQENINKLNHVAAQLLNMGHIPLIGVNAALPVVEKTNIKDKYNSIMNISMAVITACEAILLIAESPGANRERDYFISNGLPVYYDVSEIPSI